MSREFEQARTHGFLAGIVIIPAFDQIESGHWIAGSLGLLCALGLLFLPVSTLSDRQRHQEEDPHA